LQSLAIFQKSTYRNRQKNKSKLVKKKTLKFLLTLASVAAMSANYAVDVIYPGCPIPPQECVCDVLPDIYNYGVMFGAVGCETKKIIFSGLIQTDYQFIVVDDRVPNIADPSEVNNFLMRRVRFGVEADLGNNWRGVIVTDFAGKDTQNVYTSNGDAFATNPGITQLTFSGSAGGINYSDAGTVPPNAPLTMTTDYKHGIFGLYKAYIEKYCAGNFFRAGYKKVNFVREENVEDYDLKTIERSVATEFFNGTNASSSTGVASGGPLDFGERHVGLFVDGMYNNFGYGAALVNGYVGTKACSDPWDNELGIYGNLYYFNEFNCMDIELGVNAGYQPKGNGNTLQFNVFGANDTPQPWSLNRGGIWAVNPYITVNWNGWSLLAEVIGSKVEHGAVDGITDAKPIGVNVIPTYMWNDCFEIVFRGSYLDTDYRGVRMSNVVPCAPDTFNLNISNDAGDWITIPGGDLYNRANAWYIGFNYYIANRTVKFSAGYEFIRFKDRHSGLGKQITYQGQPQAVLDPGGFGTPTSVAGLGIPPHNNSRSCNNIFRARLQLVF